MAQFDKMKQIENFKPATNYIEDELYPIILGPNEFALVTGHMLNCINKELLKIIKHTSPPLLATSYDRFNKE